MTKAGYTHVAFLLDRSGSMAGLVDAVVEGFNAVLDQNKGGAGKCTITLSQFDSDKSRMRYIVSRDFEDIESVLPMKHSEFKPGGWTPLWDAFSHMIDETGRALAWMPEDERPERVLLVVMTDGVENFSHTTAADLRAKVEHQQTKYGWDFMYLGSNQDAILAGGEMGIPRQNSLSYGTQNTRQLMKAAGSMVNSYRTHGAQATSFTDQQRKELG